MKPRLGISYLFLEPPYHVPAGGTHPPKKRKTLPVARGFFTVKTVLKNFQETGILKKRALRARFFFGKISFGKKTYKKLQNDNQNLENELSEKTGLNVRVKFNDNNNRGSVSFMLTSLDQFDYIIKKIKLF